MELRKEVIIEILNYLASKPYRETAQLINIVENETRDQFKAEQGKVVEDEVVVKKDK